MRKIVITIIITLFLTVSASSKDLIQSVTSKLSTWDTEAAWQELNDYLQRDERNPELLELASRVAFFMGQYNEALRFINASIVSGGDEERKRLFSLFIEQTIEATSRLKRYETPHFIIYLEEGQDGILIEYITEAMENTFKAMALRYGFEPKEKIRIEVFPDSKSFYYASTLSARDIEMGAVGQAEFGKLMLLSPRALVHGYRWLDAMSHEYMHYMIVRMTANRAPIWFHEGLAKYEETRWRNGPSYLSPSYETLISNALKTQKLISFKRMEPSLVRLDTPEDVQLAYGQAASAIEFIILKVGHEGLKEIMKSMGKQDKKGAEEPIKELMGLTFDQFEKEWKEFLISKCLKEHKGINIKRYKVKQGETDEDRIDMEEIKSIVSRNRTHIGDRLREKGRKRASLSEYQRALSEAPESVPILNRISSILLELDRNEEAIEVLKKAHELNPDHPAIYSNMGRVYLKLNNFLKAKESFQESIQINPFNPEVHYGLAQAYEMLGDKFNALKERGIFNKLIR